MEIYRAVADRIAESQFPDLAWNKVHDVLEYVGYAEAEYYEEPTLDDANGYAEGHWILLASGNE